MPRPPVHAPPRPRTPLAWGGAILLLGTLTAGLIGAAVLLWNFIDIDSVLEASEGPPPPVTLPAPEVRLPPLPETRPWAAYVYASERAAAFFPDSTYYGALVERWNSALASVGAVVNRVPQPTSIDELPDGVLLVVPAAVCLDETERTALRRHVRRGGHLLATWALGARDGDCAWVGYEFLRRLVGAEVVGTLEPGPVTYLVAPHGGAVAAGLPPGMRIEVANEGWTMLRSGSTDVYWSDAALNPASAPGGGAAAAASRRTMASGARVAWVGYRLDAGAGTADQAVLDRMAQNAALWAAGHAIVELEPWPDGHRSAMTLTQDVEHRFENSRRLAERLRASDVPVTFFVVTELALEHRRLGPTLRSAGEVGSHGVDHRQIAGRGWGNQVAGIRKARADIEGWSGAEPLGFRPPREVFDHETLEAWGRQGGLYLAASNGARSAAPELFEVRSGSVVVLPRVVDDDYAVMVMRGRRSPDSLRAALAAATDKIRWLGGFNLVTTHTQLIDSDRRVDAVVAAALGARASGDVWIARGADVAKWWLGRSQLQLHVQERPDRSLEFAVRNDGAEPISAVRLRVHLPEDGSRYAAPELGDQTLESQYEGSGLVVSLPTVGPGQSLTILLPRRPPDAAP